MGVQIPWAPRLILTGRVFRLPVQSPDPEVRIQTEGFTEIDRRWSPRDSTLYVYLKAPETSGDFTVAAVRRDCIASAAVQVRSLAELRRPFAYNDSTWPRRWPLGRAWETAKTRQTLQDAPLSPADPRTLEWWLAQDDRTLWRQLPPSELPRAHFVNVHQGCPACGTAIFRYNGFYPWKRSHLPCDFRSTCPSCNAVFPSNDLAAGDFTAGDRLDDGYGYFDVEGHLFLFAATYHRDQTRACWSAIDQLTRELRANFAAETARKLGILLLRQAVEETYLAAVPQFRYGPTLGSEEPWNWGQPDWGAEADPVAALFRKGTVHYCIDLPYVAEVLALAYDTLWPFLRQDQELADRARALGAPVDGPAEVVQLVEEMLAGLVQASMDGGAASNLPRVSQGVLVLLASLDRNDGQEVLDWLYDRGPDRMRVFGINDFTPDGTPPEATGGYNSIHSDGLFALEHHLRRLRRLYPRAYPEDRYPSLTADPRAARVARAPHEITVIGRTWFQVGDGGSAAQPGRLTQECFHAALSPETLPWAAEYTDDAMVAEIRDAVAARRHRRLGSTVHDGAGIAILRTPEAPERAAAGITYGDPSGHRHMDLLDLQLFAHERLFLSDLGYPQSWASIEYWEGHWATHNSVWAVLPGVWANRLAGRGRLVRQLEVDGVRLVEVMADRWAWNGEERRWYRPGVRLRRLVALVDTDNDGVALIDLTRVQGGTEHWRICRGLEGTFETTVAQASRPGTLAGEVVQRGDLTNLPFPDYGGLGWMDEVAALQPPAAWSGSWRFSREEGVFLDLHQLGTTSTAEVRTARATATMGTPEESNYQYRALAWHRTPASAQETTVVDLVFEPRVGPATLRQVRSIAAIEENQSPAGPERRPGASGVELVTAAGRHLRLYWSPDRAPDEWTAFEDGARLQGALAVVVEDRVTCQGTGAFEDQTGRRTVTAPRRTGRVTAVDAQARILEVAGLSGVEAGARIVVNPDGRGHSYAVEQVEPGTEGRQRLVLDVTPLLGRCQVRQVEGKRVELEYHVMARTGNLERTRLQRPTDGAWAEIEAAHNPDSGSTVVELASPLNLRPGEWVDLVDCVPGDEVRFEPVVRVK